jgi:aldose 1-epimerase
MNQSSSLHPIQISSGSTTASIHSIGASLTSLSLNSKDIILSSASNTPFRYSGIIGRVAGRTRPYIINGTEYSPEILHGGVDAWDAKTWGVGLTTKDSLEFRLDDVSAGYPCNVSVRVVYTISEDQLRIVCEVTNNGAEDTIANPTNHSYFNLTGFKEMDLDSHVLAIPGISCKA